MRVIETAQRRARLAARHSLSAPAASVEEAVISVVGLHSSDPATVFLSAWARVEGFERAMLEDALYREKSLLRMLGMRRTMWVIPTELAPAVHHSSTARLVAGERRRHLRMIEEGGVASDGAAWTGRAREGILAALASEGEATAKRLKEVVPHIDRQITVYRADNSVEGRIGAATRMLFLLATAGEVVRTRPLGTWRSSQYRWARTDDWLGSPLPDQSADTARAEVVERWLLRFGPGTETDLRWWAGWPLRDLRPALERVGAVPVRLESGTGFVHPSDLDPEPEDVASVALLPALDPSVMGWKERGWYLGDHQGELFDRNGNAGPTVLVDGRVVGGWAQRPSGEIAWDLLEDVGREAVARVAARAAELESWLGDHVVIPRFRTPLEKRLST